MPDSSNEEPTSMEEALAKMVEELEKHPAKKPRTSKIKTPRVKKYRINPEWEVQQKANLLEFHAYTEGTSGVEQLYPEKYDKDLGEGGWIMVLMPPHTEYTVEPLSCWYAIPDPYKQFHDLGRYRVRITTPKGPLWLWPHEYQRIKDIAALVQTEDIMVNYMSQQAAVDEFKLFYLRSRGIPKREALLMLLGDINDPNFIYLTVPREVQYELAGVGVNSFFARRSVLSILDRLEREERDLNKEKDNNACELAKQTILRDGPT